MDVKSEQDKQTIPSYGILKGEDMLFFLPQNFLD